MYILRDSSILYTMTIELSGCVTKNAQNVAQIVLLNYPGHFSQPSIKYVYNLRLMLLYCQKKRLATQYII